MLLLASASPSTAQESCSTPYVIQAGTSGTEQFDLSTYANDHDTLCGRWTPGKDAVFLANSHDAGLSFLLTNVGTSVFDVQVIFTFWCDAASAFNRVYSWAIDPAFPVLFTPTISDAIYIFIDGPEVSSGNMPLRVDYELEAPSPVATCTWGMVKSMYKE